jgi:hypothetical protein
MHTGGPVSDARRERPDAGSQTPLGLRGQDEDIAHEIYHDDAVLEFPESGERFEGVENFREWRHQHAAHLSMHSRRITHRDDFVVGETSSATTAGPWMYSVRLLEFRATRSRTSASTSWTAGKRPIGEHPGGPTHPRIHHRPAAEPLTQVTVIARSSASPKPSDSHVLGRSGTCKLSAPALLASASPRSTVVGCCLPRQTIGRFRKPTG